MTGAEIVITADLVRDLLREQHPDLAGLAVPKYPMLSPISCGGVTVGN